MNLRDTIAAISTPPGRGGIGVVRLSGASARSIAESLIRLRAPFEPRRAAVGELLDADGQTVDEVVATFFAAPRSYTAEDLVEISCHGSPVVLRHAIARAVWAGARAAEPGEFTLRAFLNGRIDLPQAEGIRDLIESTTLYQARVAALQTQGSVSRRLGPVKAQLLELITLLEAGIDFAEDDISVAPPSEILRRIEPVIDEVRRFARSFAYGALVRNGFSLAIVGLPNAGKSSLFNQLLEQDRAIVTDIPGTTRDMVSENVDLEGIPVRVVDTAGIREAGGLIEKLGIERSLQAMSDADIRVVVADGTLGRDERSEELAARAAEAGPCVLVRNKSDLPAFVAREGILSVSALSGNGIPELRRAILNGLVPRCETEIQGGFITSLRQENLLRESLAMLEKGRDATKAALPHELLLLDLYCALQPLDAITGATTADDILNRIFSSFCIGK